jgi:aspartate aminotransferase
MPPSAPSRRARRYTDVSGTKALREAAAGYFKREHGLDYKPEEIVVSTGGKQVIFNAMLATIGPATRRSSRALLGQLPDIVTLAEGKPVIVPPARTRASR